MSGFAGSSKSTRTYGEFSTSSAANSLFDAAFSKPVVRKRFNKFPSTGVPDEPVLPSVTEEHSPQQVFSPPISLPESNSTEGNAEDRNLEGSGSEDDSIEFPPSTKSTTGLTRATPPKKVEKTGTSTNMTDFKRPATSTYDFDDDDDIKAYTPPPGKKQKEEDSPSPPKTKFIPHKERRNIPVYRHRWTEAQDDDEDDFDKEMNRAPVSKDSVYNEPKSRVRKVKDAQECRQSGERDDYKQDLEYIMTSVLKSDVSDNIKRLSAFSLTKKCASRSFRQFLRTETGVNRIIRLFPDAPKDYNQALCISAFIYLMARDFVEMKVDPPSLRIIAQLLKMDTQEKSAGSLRYVDQIWTVFNDYLEQIESMGAKCVFEISKDKLTPAALTLESLVYLLARTGDENFKTELLNLGCLQHIVSKIEKAVLSLIHDKSSNDVRSHLHVLERCFRIIESATTYHKKNQHFLISHRGSVLIQMCGKLTAVIHTRVPELSESLENVEDYLKCLSLVARVLMNLSHDSELCASKLGQIDGFLHLCVQSFTFLSPKYAAGDKKFDYMVMSLSLLVNLVEKVNSNRNKVLGSTVQLYNDDGSVTEEKALDALVKRYVAHEETARSHDEDLDKELAFEEPVDGGDSNSEDEDGPSQSGRLNRAKIDDMSEAEMLDCVQNAMGKASAHMEDSVVASYLALAVGCLLQQHDEYIASVKAILPNKDLSGMKDQLQRFHDFMKLANPKSKGSASIAKIIGIFEDLEKFV